MNDFLAAAAHWFVTGGGRVTAAIGLLAMVYVVRFFPGIAGKYLQEGWRQRALAALLATAPAIALDLTTDVPLEQLLTTSVLSFLGATGLHHIAADALPRLGSGKDADAALKAAVHAVLVPIIRELEAEVGKRSTVIGQAIKVYGDPETVAAAIEGAIAKAVDVRNPGSGESPAPTQSPQDEPTAPGGPAPEPEPPGAS